MRRIITAAGLAAVALAGVHAVAQNQPPAAQDAQERTVPAVRSGTYAVDKSHARILWSVSHFGFSTYYGTFTDFDARLQLDAETPENSRLEVTVRTASAAAHDAALERHLRTDDFFAAEAHPEARFVSTAVRRTGAGTAQVTGDFTLRGITRPLTLDVTFNGAGDGPVSRVYTVGFSATGSVRRSEHGMTFGVPGVGDEVGLIISAEFNPAG